MSEFDPYAAKYAEVVDESIKASGYGWEYFARNRAGYCARIAASDPPAKVLDYGCGVGLVSRFLKELFPAAEVHGFDVSPESVALVDPGLRRQGVFTSRLEELDDDYDLAVVAGVLHHVLPGDRGRVIDLVARKLSAVGRLVVFEQNPLNPLTRRVVERCPFDENAVLLRARETLGLLKAAGLAVRRRDYIVFFPKPLAPLAGLEPLLGWCPLGAQYAVVAERSS